MIKKMCFLKRKPSLPIVNNNSSAKIRILHAKFYVMLKAIHTFRKDYWQFCFSKIILWLSKNGKTIAAPFTFRLLPMMSQT